MREAQLFFGAFHLDPANASLRLGERPIVLTPKAFDVLRYLAQHSGQLVTKDDLWQAVWPGIAVTDAALTMCMSEIRKALGETARSPRYIQTVHRRGYRFIATVTTRPVRPSETSVENGTLGSVPHPQSAATNFVGRESELAQLHNWLEKTLGGERQIIFVSGEPGIGKTALVEAFLEQVAANGNLLIGRGQCIQHYGVGEAYMPVLEALGRLCREHRGRRLVEILAQQAPTWLAQMPALLGATELEALQRKVAGATRARMLRELVEAMEVITAEAPLVVLLEDVHWSDYSTLDWLACLARRQETARLLVLCTYRPAEVMVGKHPLNTVKQELLLHNQCKELAVSLLSEPAVVQYLSKRFASPVVQHDKEHTDSRPVEFVGALANAIYQRTDGNPLFMVNTVDYLIAQGVVVKTDNQWRLQKDLTEAEGEIPDGLKQMILRQTEELGLIEREILEAASVAGAEFSVATVAAGLETNAGEAEERCEALCRRGQFLRRAGLSEWPDATVATRYGFIHVLYQEVLYREIMAGRRADLHRRIGQCKESAYGDSAREIAAELATHFERGGDYRAAVKYRRLAGENAARVSAHQEAITHLRRGLDLLTRWPDTLERSQEELALQMAIGAASLATTGFGTQETGKAYTRAYELCGKVGVSPQLFPVLMGLRFFYTARGELRKARELGERLLQLADGAGDAGLLVEANYALAVPLYFLAEFSRAREHLERSIALYDFQQHRDHAVRYELDPGVAARSLISWVLWVLGYPDQALQRSREALHLAREISHPFTMAYAMTLASTFLLWRRAPEPVLELTERLIPLGEEHGFSSVLTSALLVRDGALASQRREGHKSRILQGLNAPEIIGSQSYVTGYFARLIDQYANNGETEEGMRLLNEALAGVEDTGEHHYEAELYRLKGELASSDQLRASQAEESFRMAILVARRQNAKLLELRATISLARLLDRSGERDKSRAILAEIYDWFTEGFDTADLKDAQALLQELNG